jgi:hypothetical protein
MGGVIIFKDLHVYFLGAFVVVLLVFEYGFFNLFGGVVCCDFVGFIFGFFC